ncbi:Endonuclease 8-like 3 [Bagarius yarrelli]|uniref:Endonuclease 8-like 3 n=1 Tax=Bagarius yarrelli TaxID=175774 RepID=A0A556U8Y0_BAGYA|nr:Endonuclease 8-like 3 [Bagarius yarrelli]
MVEGPGCTLNGEKIRSRNYGAGARDNLFQCFKGCQYSGVQTLGKELFMYFGERALRLHFGMDGSMRINTTERKDSRGKSLTLFIAFTEDSLTFYSTTAEIRYQLRLQNRGQRYTY